MLTKAVEMAHGASCSQNIRMVDIQKSFNGQTALERLNLEIADRELLVVLGPSGSGKSTTLNLLAGLELASSGEIFFGDERVTDVPTERRNISMVFQANTLYPHKNVRDNILFALKVAKVPRDVQQQRMRDTTRLLGIEPFLDRRIDQLSGGQRQRVAIAKALVKRPKLFLLDEPFAALDAQLRRELRGELVRIHRELETTMLFVTHDQEEAIAIADRVAVMNKGELVQLGPALDIYIRPTNTWIAGFVGPHSINFLDVELHSDGSRGYVNSPCGRIAVDPDTFARVQQSLGGRRAILGFRPEFATLSSASSSDSMPAEVYSRQNLGSSILYHLKSGGLDHRAVAPVNQRLDIGQRVNLRLSWAHSVWFDPASKALVVGPAENELELRREEVSQ